MYNVGSNRMNYSKQDVCEMIKTQIKCYVHYAEVGEDADKRNYVVSYRKINALGYQTMITVEEGIRELLHGFQVLNVRNPYANA